MLPKIKNVQALNNYHLVLEFENLEVRIFDVSELFMFSVFEPLKDSNLFHRFSISNGSLTWQDQIELHYEDAYVGSKPL